RPPSHSGARRCGMLSLRSKERAPHWNAEESIRSAAPRRCPSPSSPRSSGRSLASLRPEVEALPARDAQEPVARERIAFAAVLDSGPGKLRVEVVAAVHEEGARLDLRSDAEGALLIAGPDRRGEAVRRIVHQADRVVVVGRSEEHTSELQSPYDIVCR